MCAAGETGERFDRALIGPVPMALLKNVARFLHKEKVKAYLVGGLVRDALLGRDTADIDLAVATDTTELGKQLTEMVRGRAIVLDEVNKVVRIILPENYAPKTDARYEIDLVTYGGRIEDDLARRDFTIDAMAIDLHKLTGRARTVPLIDPAGGRTDLDRGILRSVAATAFPSDPLRLLRVVRLATELGFRVDRQTEAQVRQHASLLAGVPGERVREELLRLLELSRGGQVFSYLHELGLLTAMIPEFAGTAGVTQPPEHHWDVLHHSLMTVTAVDAILRQSVWEFGGNDLLQSVPWSAELAHHFTQPVTGGSTRRSLLKLAALLHDIAKPQTRATDEEGRLRFLGHCEQGAEITAAILERLRFSARETKLVSLVVQYHLRPTQMAQDELPSRRAIYRYFRDTAEVGIDTLYLSLADHLATRGPGLLPANWQWHNKVVRHVLAEHSRQQEVKPPVKLIDGNDLINLFGMKPGRKLGELLEQVKEAQAAGELTTRQQALQYIHNVLQTEGKK